MAAGQIPNAPYAAPTTRRSAGLVQKASDFLRKERTQYAILLIPALFFYLVFSIGPVVSGIGVATTDMVTVATSYNYIGLDNFQDILFSGSPNSAKFYEALGWTAAFWLGNWAMIFLLGFIPALILYENIRFKGAFLIIIFLPYVISNLAIGFLMRMVLDPNIGALNAILMGIGLIDKPIIFLADGWPAMLVMIFITGWKFAGFNAAIFLGGLVSVPFETIEAAKIDGANYFQTLRRVVIPQMMPTIIAASVICFTGTWRLFDIPVALAGSTAGGIKSLDVLAVVFYRWAFSTVGFGYASAMMVIVAIILFIGAAFQLGLLRRTADNY